MGLTRLGTSSLTPARPLVAGFPGVGAPLRRLRHWLLLVAKFLLCVGVNHLSEAQTLRELARVHSPSPVAGFVGVGAVGLSRAHECQVKQKMQTR